MVVCQHGRTEVAYVVRDCPLCACQKRVRELLRTVYWLTLKAELARRKHGKRCDGCRAGKMR